MYDPHLETFLKAADAGSFSKAAAQAYISPTAVIKQINALEKDLGVRLFDRSHKGLRLTPAGKSIYRDAKYIISYSADAVARAQNSMQQETRTIRIGSSPMTPADLFIPLWTQIRLGASEFKFEIVPYENTPENADRLLRNLGDRIDIIAGIFDDTMLKLRRCAGLELSREQFCVAVSPRSPLAKNGKLNIQDLYGQTLLLMRRGWSSHVDALRDELEQHHPAICISDFTFYNTDVFNHCENSFDLLLAIPGWANVHPFLRLIPVNWNHWISYGILHSPTPSETVCRFLEAARTAMNQRV